MKHVYLLFISFFSIIGNTVYGAEQPFNVELTPVTMKLYDAETKQVKAFQTNSDIIYGRGTLQYGAADIIDQKLGKIRFNEPEGIAIDSRAIADEIHHQCKSSDNLDSIEFLNRLTKAESLLSTMQQETVEQKLHHCVALVRLGEACLGLFYPHNLDRALPYFYEATTRYNFTGAMLAIGLITAHKIPISNKPAQEMIEAIYWMQRAQENGHEHVTDCLKNLKDVCYNDPESRRALEQWDAACKIKGLHHPAEDGLPSIHNVD